MVSPLAAKEVSLGYADIGVVKRVSLELVAGEICAVIGENGAGKSTLLKGMAGLLAPSEGKVELFGEPIGQLDLKARAQRVSVLPQLLRYLPGMTVEEFVTQGRYSHRPNWHSMSPEDEKAVETSIAETELEQLRLRAIDELSGGERQRAILARALAQDADVLLVDEPTSALDGRHRLWAFEKFAELAQRGRAIMIVTHDLNLASQFADKILILQDGQSLAHGAPQDVLTPKNLGRLLGHQFLTGLANAGEGRGQRPWFIPWSRDEDREQEGPRLEDPCPDGE